MTYNMELQDQARPDSMGTKLKKLRYFQWVENLTPDENGCLDQWVEENRERSIEAGITFEDRLEWAALKEKDQREQILEAF